MKIILVKYLVSNIKLLLYSKNYSNECTFNCLLHYVQFLKMTDFYLNYYIKFLLFEFKLTFYKVRSLYLILKRFKNKIILVKVFML